MMESDVQGALRQRRDRDPGWFGWWRVCIGEGRQQYVFGGDHRVKVADRGHVAKGRLH
jgi:hypothetical protein